VHFEIDQPIGAPRDAVERTLVDSAYYAALSGMPNLGTPEVLERTESDGVVSVSVRYAFTGAMSPAVQAVLDPDKLTWVIHTSFDLAEHHASFTMVPDHYTDLLTCSGTHLFLEAPAGTQQIAEGELKVNFPIVGRNVERAIVGGLERHVAGEAAAIEAWVAEHP
jgi:hypothetical protein